MLTDTLKPKMLSARSIKILIWSLIVFGGAYYNMFRFNGNFKSYRKGHRNFIYKYNGTEDFLINTTGCYIPNYAKKFHFLNAKKVKSSCGTRAVFVEKVSDDTIRFRIDEKKIKNYKKNIEKIRCCYRYARRHNEKGKEDFSLQYSSCKNFTNGTKIILEHEVIVVSCSRVSHITSNTFHETVVYKDSYLVLKKKTENKTRHSTESWNVLMLGMDTMSRSRVYEEMPKTSKYFRTHNWVDFRGYQKVASNTFPNLIAFLTARKTVYPQCSKGMYECNDIFIWSKFKEAGYKTAYGEDFIRLPDTFANYKGFRKPPTDHYTRPFFLTGEYQSGNLVCTGTRPSALHLLDYASEFCNTYKDDKFFGLFWLNSYSHNIANDPTLIDEDLANLFSKLNRSGVLDNTFVFFLSDHGIRFGPQRESLQLYYGERLPTLFMWAPPKFLEIYNDDYYSLRINENRLVTPYDLHATLWDILKLSNSSVKVVPPEACPKCSSLFKEIPEHRTCTDVNVSEKWCTCHNMVPVPFNDTEAKQIVLTAVRHIQKAAEKTATTPCHVCSPLTLRTVYRIHSYIRDDSKKYFVLAFAMNPGNLGFEANIVKVSNNYQLLSPTYTISQYNSKGNCVIKRYDRDHCVCLKLKKCKK